MKTLLASLFGIILAATSAQASFHLWQITQLYSDPTGTVQFIELTNGNFDGENLLTGHTITSNTNSYTFPSNLPFNTANHHFLIATPGYVAISGAPAPDYVLPSNNWFSVTSDTINYAGVNMLSFTPGQLPTDGVTSLNRMYNSMTLFIAPNSPTNFAGATGSVSPTTHQLRNISTRGLVGTGDNVLIGGFILGGNGMVNGALLIRAIGPSLTAFGVPGALQDPTLELHDHTGAVIAFDDNWKDTQQAQIQATGLAPTDDRESAIYATLPAGAYTAIVRGANNTTGVALVEVYNLQ